MKHLESKNIQAILHYVPLHSSKAGLKFAQVSGSMQVTEDISQRLVRLPLYYGVDDNDISRVIQEVRAAFN